MLSPSFSAAPNSFQKGCLAKSCSGFGLNRPAGAVLLYWILRKANSVLLLLDWSVIFMYVKTSGNDINMLRMSFSGN
jgi:hypothetical protein